MFTNVHRCLSFCLMFTNVHQCFLLNIVYFSVCLTSNKLYWIDDQLADVSTRFYTSASWRRRVGPSVSWLVTEMSEWVMVITGLWSDPVSTRYFLVLIIVCFLVPYKFDSLSWYIFELSPLVISGLLLQLNYFFSSCHDATEDSGRC